MATPTPPRTLADQLRRWPDELVASLLRSRPDLVSPTPQDSAQLASRAAVRSSLLRAMDGLTRLELAVLEALVITGPCSATELEHVVRAAPDATAEALDRLTRLALAWESPEGLRALTGVADGLTGTGAIGRLRPCSPEADATAATTRLEAASAPARALLEHLDEAGGEGTSAARTPVSPDEAATPAEELLARRLVVARPGGVVVVPGEVSLALRGGTTTREPVDDLPGLAASARDAAVVAKAAAGAAFEAVRRTELLLDHWSTAPPTALRSGGLGVRDLKAAATLLHVDEREAGLLVEVAAAAGLLATGADLEGDLAWLPTDGYDAWAARPTAERWAALAVAWLDTSRLPALVGSKDRRSGKGLNALTPELSSIYAAETRRMALDELAALPDGEVLAAGTGVPSVVARLAWLRPRRPASRGELVTWALDEAAMLGVTGLGGLPAYARALLGGGDPAAALTALLPEPVDHVLLQADLTAVAPGPLESSLAQRLHAVADVDSRGGATVYRFTPDSVRRALDLGWTSAELHDFVGSVSRTPVPQPLTYLVDDVARRFGTLRVGAVEAFLRSDDETALTELMHHPKAASLQLRRLAPTVLVTTLPVDLLLPRLRELGAAPVVEAPDGSVHIARPDRQRARLPRSRPTGLSDAKTAARLTAVVTAIRAGDKAAAARPSRPTTANPAEVLARLREAVEARRTVWIGYVDNAGTTVERIIDPVSVEGGQLVAFDHRTDDERVYAVHRITAVRGVAAG
ncbi:helicase C-terminal domain-containing protein [Nocardioides sp.]|uniref:helicase C-terminal domain-containing protein n=1 Tax=Nocardioides sp. TaxID=35761 RepID=UPI003528F7C9